MTNINHRIVEAAIGVAAQPSLPLGDAPDSDASLRVAFERSGLRKLGFSFEWAIEDELIRRCLANIAEAALRARANQRWRA